MKKAVLAVGGALGIVAAGVLAWTLIFPFICTVLQKIWSCVTSLL